MGYLKHNAVIVTHWNAEALKKAHQKAREIFKEKFVKAGDDRKVERLVSDVINGITNGQATFVIVPDGSKEGWNDSELCDEARTEFLDWLSQNGTYEDYIEIRFGGDDEDVNILRSNDLDIKEVE